VAQHVRVDRKGESGATADALDEAVDGIRRERATALGGEDKGRIRGLPAQLAQGSHLVASQRMGATVPRPAASKACESLNRARTSFTTATGS
jgi:hypothetical protein